MVFQIYLAGGMGNLPYEQQCGWRDKFTKEITSPYRYHKDYHLIIVNPVNYYNFESVEYKSQREVMEFDINKVRQSNLIIVNFNDPQSIGTAMELAIARENRIPIIGLNADRKELHPWLTEHCTRICDTMDELVQHINDFYLK